MKDENIRLGLDLAIAIGKLAWTIKDKLYGDQNNQSNRPKHRHRKRLPNKHK